MKTQTRKPHAATSALPEKAPMSPFETRLRSHMDTYGWSRVAPTGREKELWQELHQQGGREENRRAAYVHIPFCGTLCTFCNFQRKCGTPAMAADYAEWVMKELQWYRRSAYIAQGRFEAFYMGGGTPSLLPAAVLADLVTTACDVLQLSDEAEITVETTIHDLNEEKLRAMVDAGVTRISLGVQTFDSEARRNLGRLSNKDTVCKMVETARAAGMQTISADLLYRLPGQTVDDFLVDLQCANELGLDGISIYPLIAMPGTPLEKGLQNGKVKALPDLQLELEQCRAARDYLREAGYRQDTSTHFARETDRNLYATVRLDDGDCLPIGCGAGGYLGSLVLMNAMSKETYQACVEGGEAGYMAGVALPARSRLLRSATGQLQRGFLNLDTLWNDGTLSAEDMLADKLAQHVESGLLQQDGTQFNLTPDGWAWCYNIAADVAELAVQDTSEETTSKDGMMAPILASQDASYVPTPKHGQVKADNGFYGFALKDLSVLGVMCALVVVVQFVGAMILHATGVAVIPGAMQFAMGFMSCLVLFVALRKVPKPGALSIIAAVYSMVTMLLSGSVLMGLGLVIGGVLGDVAARLMGGIHRTVPLIAALVVYRTCQTGFSKLYAYIMGITQVELVWYLIVLSLAATALGALMGSLAGIKLTGRIAKAGVMS